MKMKITEFADFFFKNVLCFREEDDDYFLSYVYLKRYFNPERFKLIFEFVPLRSHWFEERRVYSFSLDSIPFLRFSLNSYSVSDEFRFCFDIFGQCGASFKVSVPLNFSFLDFGVKIGIGSYFFECLKYGKNRDKSRVIRDANRIGKYIISRFTRDSVTFAFSRFGGFSFFNAFYVLNPPPSCYYENSIVCRCCFSYLDHKRICTEHRLIVSSVDFYLEFSNDFLKFLNSYLKRVNCCLCSIYEERILERIRVISKIFGR